MAPPFRPHNKAISLNDKQSSRVENGSLGCVRRVNAINLERFYLAIQCVFRINIFILLQHGPQFMEEQFYDDDDRLIQLSNPSFQWW